jgi:carboxylesterase type B
MSQWQEVEENIMDEDCLYLNIWVPADGDIPSAGWPVQFIFRGWSCVCP